MYGVSQKKNLITFVTADETGNIVLINIMTKYSKADYEEFKKEYWDYQRFF